MKSINLVGWIIFNGSANLEMKKLEGGEHGKVVEKEIVVAVELIEELGQIS